MAYDFSKGSKTIRKVGFLDGVNGSKIRPVSPFPLESSKGLVAKYFDSTKESLSATRLLDQSPLNSGTRRTGEEGRCYLYDGVDDYSTLDAGFTASGDFTLSFNINATSFSPAFHVFIASTTSDRIYFNNGTSFNIVANGTLSGFTLDAALVAGTWYNILVRRVSGTITVYVDGVAQSDTESNSEDLDFLYFSRVGGAANLPLNAKLFDVRYFNSTITDSELNYVISFGRTGTPVTPTNWWKCDEQSGTIGYDSVGGNHLTHNNITSGTFHATQDIWSFQNQVGYNKRMYFDGVGDYVEFTVPSFSQGKITATLTVPSGAGTFTLFSDYDNANKFIGIAENGNASANVFGATGVIKVDGVTATTRGDLYAATVGKTTSIEITNVSLTSWNNFAVGAYTFYAGLNDPYYIYDLSFDLTNDGAIDNSYNGYGNTDADWIDQIGSNNGTVNGSPSSILLPRDESDPTNDVLGNPLTNTGRRPNDASLHSSNCLTLNGTNQAVRVADNTDLDITDNLTVCVWAKNDNSTLSGVQGILGKWDSGVSKREWSIFINTDEKIDVRIGSSDGSGTTTQVANTAIDPSVIHHYAFTFESGEVKLYIDGILITSTASASHVSALNNEDSDLMLGSVLTSDSAVNYWDGQIFDARIYAGDSTVLTAAQIKSIYDDGVLNKTFEGQTLKAHYKLAEGGGDQCLDSSGNENHGTIENAATNWSVTQDVYHSNLSEGFVYAYQPAKQVFTGAQAANITGISFKFRSTDTSLAVLDSSGAFPYFLYILQGSSSTDLFHSSITGTITVIIDGSTEWGTTRGDLFSSLCDGEVHEVSVTGVTFTGGWLTNGLFVNSWSGGAVWDSTTYLWDLVATDSNGDPIYPADPDVRLPAVTSSLGPYSIPLTDLPSNGYRNRAETLIDLDPDSTPEMNNIYLESVFNGSTSNGYVTNDSVLNFTDNLTVSCWAKSDLTDITSSADTLVSMYEDTGNLEVWRMEISTDEKLRFQVGNSGGTGATIETADSAYPIDTWTHYAATFDGGVVKLYVNGELQSSSESSAHATSLNGRSAPLVLGAYYWSGGGGSFGEWDGALRNIRVYKGDSSPLSNSQIVRDMIETASQPRFEGQTVIASYDLVKDALDRSGNNLNAQNNNISFTKKTVPASLDLGTDLGEDGIVQKTVKFDSGEWGAVFDGSSYMIVKNREKLKIKEKPFSIECSVKTSDTGSNTILSKYQTSGNLRSYSLNIESGKIVFHSSSNGTAVVSSTGSDTINDGSWHKIKVVRESESGTSLKMYVDDVEDTGVGGSLASNFSENISNVAIGAYNTDATAANVFTGNIRELKVFTDDNIERASWELAKDTRDSSSNNYHGENNGITFLTPKQEYGYTVSDSTPLAKQDQYLKEYHKSRLFL